MPAPDYAPENAETGTQNQEGMVGTAAAIDFLSNLSEQVGRRERLRHAFDEMHARNATRAFVEWPKSIPRVRLYGPGPDKPRTVSFTIENCESTEAARRFAEKGLFLSHGDFYAYTVVQRLGLEPEGLIRAGCACYTTVDEIDRLLSRG